jgi:hypothetical protein
VFDRSSVLGGMWRRADEADSVYVHVPARASEHSCLRAFTRACSLAHKRVWLCVRVRARWHMPTHPHSHKPSHPPTHTHTHSNTPRCVEPASIDASAGSEGSGGGGENPVIAVGCGNVCTVFSTVDGRARMEAVSYLQV